VVVCNMKPSKLVGVMSHAMVLAGKSSDGSIIELVKPPAAAKVGERIAVQGYNTADDEKPPQLNPKKKIFETIQPGFTTLKTREGAWVDPSDKSKVYRIITSKGPCTAPTVVGGSLS